jgi:hypothetical protein
MQERVNITGKQVNGMKRKGDQIVYEKLSADIVASKFSWLTPYETFITLFF